MIRARLRVLVSVALLLVAGCRREAPPVAEAEPELPPPAPIGVNEVVAISVTGDTLILATSAGLVDFDPAAGSHALRRAGPDLSPAGVRSMALATDGTAWTAHSAPDEQSHGHEHDPMPAEAAGAPRAIVVRHGGLRAYLPDGSVEAFFVEQGLPSNDCWAVAALDGGVIAAATAGGLAILDPATRTFTPIDASPRRRMLVIDPSAGGASRTLTEFRPRDETITSLLGRGQRLWLGTDHGLLALENGAWLRHRIPGCRRDGRAADVVTVLGPRPDGVVAALGLDGERIEPSGLVEIREEGRAATCHVPGVDVPASLTTAVASDGRTTWMATYEGLLRIRGPEVVLLERGRELPELPPMAVAVSDDGAAWVGFWGSGIGHVSDAGVTMFRLGPGEQGIAERTLIPVR